MAQKGTCPNYAGCLLAYRNETITVPDGEPFVCPECKQPLIKGGGAAAARKVMAIPMIILGGICLLVIMGAGAIYFQVRHSREKQTSGQMGSSFEQAQNAADHGDLMPSRHMEATPTPTPEVTASPTEAIPINRADEVQAQAPNFDPRDQQNQRVKADVLKRIDLMPTITPEDKDKLYMSVDRARQMGRILTIPFPSGKVGVSPTDIDQLRTALATPELQTFQKDPTCVFVVLGFADPTGDEKANMHISTERAQSVLDAMRDHCNVLNVMHAVGMGGSNLFGNQKDAARNRVVEVWAVLP